MNVKTWNIVSNKKHNAFTDLVFWNEQYWLVYVSSPSHFWSDKSQIVVSRSDDGKNWSEVTRLDVPGQDIRDPKFANYGKELGIFAYLNKQLDPSPYKTVLTRSSDGHIWSAFRDVAPVGWLLGRPIKSEGEGWYAPAHRTDHGDAALMYSINGEDWKVFSSIFTGSRDRADETALYRQLNGTMVAVSRLENGDAIFGSDLAGTLVSVSDAPYSSWSELFCSHQNRLDSPVLFSLPDDQRLFAVGRRQTQIRAPFQKQGSAFAPKRTALFEVFLSEEKGHIPGLEKITDLPSSGDTAYAGVVVKNDRVLISYYTNEPKTDPLWLFGMLRPTQIEMAEIEIENF